MGCLVMGLARPAGAQTSVWPDAPDKLAAPLTRGSGADMAARIVAQSLARQWKQAVVVDNGTSAGGLIGNTLLVQSVSYAANPVIFKKLP